MKIINVKQIVIKEKDTIEIEKLKDFLEINKVHFQDGMIYNLNNKYYLIGTEVIYIYDNTK